MMSYKQGALYFLVEILSILDKGLVKNNFKRKNKRPKM
jgi:hypothetical protein